MSTVPLAGLRVLDFTRALAGPFCSMMLGALGADVIKIEAHGRGDEAHGWGPPLEDGESTYFLSCNRNKRSVTLDLKKPGSRFVVTRLVERSDVLVENFSPGTMDRLGLSYAPAATRNPALLYCSISGLGQAGPRRDRQAYDMILQGMGRPMSVTGPRGGAPQKAAFAHFDRCAAGQGLGVGCHFRTKTTSPSATMRARGSSR